MDMMIAKVKSAGTVLRMRKNETEQKEKETHIQESQEKHNWLTDWHLRNCNNTGKCFDMDNPECRDSNRGVENRGQGSKPTVLVMNTMVI